MDTIELTDKACNSLSEKVNEDIIPKRVKYPINNLLAGFKKRNRFGIFRIPVLIINQNVESGKYRIHSLRLEYDEEITNIASELKLEYSNEHYFRGARIL